MKSNWELTEDSFKLFLGWLDSDEDAAGLRYEALRRDLIKKFNDRRCAVSEDLADETFDRVIRRLPAMIGSYRGDPAAYIHAAARSVYFDHLEKRWDPLPEKLPDQSYSEENHRHERVSECQDRCVNKLDPGDRRLVLQYYREDKQAKINHRKRLAEALGIELEAMRTRMHRLRKQLRLCIQGCMEHS